jgi:hypothetical protein
MGVLEMPRAEVSVADIADPAVGVRALLIEVRSKIAKARTDVQYHEVQLELIRAQQEALYAAEESYEAMLALMEIGAAPKLPAAEAAPESGA